jgi:predicted signal transduction protein with EAL and GGDEF domain
VRERDTVARLGGDEFVVLCANIDRNEEEATKKIVLIAEKIRVSLSQPYMLREREYHCSPSIGVSLFHDSTVTDEELLKNADIAMYQAKESGRNAVRFFDPDMQQVVNNRATLEAALRHVISERQLHLYYQVQVNSDLHPIGAEALVRWIHPERGMISPLQFIPIAEESSLILEIGNWVLESACRQLSVWAQSEYSSTLTLAVNVSAKQFKQTDFVERVVHTMQAHGVTPSRLKLELTESVVLNDIVDMVNKMHALKRLGVRLSMDDFGTGYSSLSYLKQLPIDQLKIDQSFVRDITVDQNDAMMVQTIIDMAKNFRLNVIAEGVETEAQLAFLQAHGCMAYQGYLFSKPLPLEQFDAFIKNRCA